MSERWRPLSVRQGGEEAVREHDALHEGVPEWLSASLTHWTASQLCSKVSAYTDGMPFYHWSRSALLGVERDLKIALPWNNAVSGAGERLLAMANSNPALFLDLLDYLLSRTNANYAGSEAGRLELLLETGGSAWRVAERDNRYSLERRVAAGVAAAATEAMRSPRAGDLLRLAWVEAYGRDPNPSDAYRNAVRAVEAAAQPTIIPKDHLATLGKMIAAIRAAPQKWQLVFSTHRTIDVVADMFETLWRGQFDRHGSADPSIPINVSLEEAQAAFHLAATLVQWFTAEHITLAPHASSQHPSL